MAIWFSFPGYTTDIHVTDNKTASSEHRYDSRGSGQIGEGAIFICQPYLHGKLGA
jgi:hypothetical protein